MMKYRKNLLIFLLIFFSMAALYAQNNENTDTRYNRRIVWISDEYTYRYNVHIDILENGTYRSHIREFTTAAFLSVSLPAGDYRFRIIPHDILDRPQPGTQWVQFSVRPPVVPDTRDQAADMPVQEEEIQIISQLPDNREQETDNNQNLGLEQRQENEETEDIPETESKENSPRFNTIGISIGSGFSDPLAIITLHGSYTLFRNIFIELGCEYGFLSMYDYVSSIYCLYPYVNLGVFLPFSEKGGFFTGVGGGYMSGAIELPEGTYDISIFGLNIFAGINLWDMMNISYTFRTTFEQASHKFAIGFVYRFKEQGTIRSEQ